MKGNWNYSKTEREFKQSMWSSMNDLPKDSESCHFDIWMLIPVVVSKSCIMRTFPFETSSSLSLFFDESPESGRKRNLCKEEGFFSLFVARLWFMIVITDQMSLHCQYSLWVCLPPPVSVFVLVLCLCKENESRRITQESVEKDRLLCWFPFLRRIRGKWWSDRRWSWSASQKSVSLSFKLCVSYTNAKVDILQQQLDMWRWTREQFSQQTRRTRNLELLRWLRRKECVSPRIDIERNPGKRTRRQMTLQMMITFRTRRRFLFVFLMHNSILRPSLSCVWRLLVLISLEEAVVSSILKEKGDNQWRVNPIWVSETLERKVDSFTNLSTHCILVKSSSLLRDFRWFPFAKWVPRNDTQILQSLSSRLPWHLLRSLTISQMLRGNPSSLMPLFMLFPSCLPFCVNQSFFSLILGYLFLVASSSLVVHQTLAPFLLHASFFLSLSFSWSLVYSFL